MPRLNVVAKLWLAFTGLIIVVVLPLELALHNVLGEFYAIALDLVPLDVRKPAAATVSPLAEQKGVTVEVRVPADLPKPMADSGRIQQVVVNLMDNALRYTPSGGALRAPRMRAGERPIVTAHGGDVGAESQPGEGSTFWFTVPARTV